MELGGGAAAGRQLSRMKHPEYTLRVRTEERTHSSEVRRSCSTGLILPCSSPYWWNMAAA